MGLDLRIPIGLMFVILAAVLAGYGWLVPDASAPLTHFNINLYWGLLLLVFGAVMLALALVGRDPKN